MNVEAEQALLGALLANNRSLNAVIDFLKPSHFAEAAHGRIYAEACRRILGGSVADAVTLRPWFAVDPDFRSLGGADYLGKLVASMIGLPGVREYAMAILDTWQRRTLIALGTDIQDRAFAASAMDGADNIAKSAAEALYGVISGVKSLPKLSPISRPNVTPLDHAEAALNRVLRVCWDDGAVGKWPAGATAQSLAEAGHLSIAGAGRDWCGSAVSCGS